MYPFKIRLMYSINIIPNVIEVFPLRVVYFKALLCNTSWKWIGKQKEINVIFSVSKLKDNVILNSDIKDVLKCADQNARL